MFAPPQALSAQEDLEKAKEELKNAVILVPAPLGKHAENEHDEHDENHAEASAELSNEGVSHLDLRSEEERVTEAQKNQRVKQQLQVRVWSRRRLHPDLDPALVGPLPCTSKRKVWEFPTRCDQGTFKY